MSRTYFDAVLDENMQPLFNGTPEATKEWLRNRTESENNNVQVSPGHQLRLMTVEDYLKS